MPHLETSVFSGESLEDVFPALCHHIMSDGKEVSPRGMITKELHPCLVEIHNPKKRIITNLYRRVNPGFLTAEALWILAGRNDLDFIKYYNGQLAQFSDDGGKTLNSAPGYRMRFWDGLCNDQMSYVIEELRRDPDSRRCVISFFNPSMDSFSNNQNYVCASEGKFLLRDGKLDFTTVWRSNDVILGFTYDAHNMMLIQETVAGILGVEVGTYFHIADSMHLYEAHFDMATNVVEHASDVIEYETMDAEVSEDQLKMMILSIDEFQSQVVVASDSVYNMIEWMTPFWQSYFLAMAFMGRLKRKDRGGAAKCIEKIPHQGIAAVCSEWLSSRIK